MNIDPSLKRAARFLKDRRTGLVFPDEGGVTFPLSAFLPKEEMYPEGSFFETSVILHKDDSDIPWDAGVKIFKSDEYGCEQKVPVACADIAISDVVGAGLSVILSADKRVSELHANIRGWSVDKDLRDLSAAVLAGKSELRIRPGCEESVERKKKKKTQGRI